MCVIGVSHAHASYSSTTGRYVYLTDDGCILDGDSRVTRLNWCFEGHAGAGGVQSLNSQPRGLPRSSLTGWRVEVVSSFPSYLCRL